MVGLERNIYDSNGGNGSPGKPTIIDPHEFPASLEENHARSVRDVMPEDIPGIRQLFRMFLRPEESKTGGINMDSHHVFHEDINNFPVNWRNPDEVQAFDDSLERFYFPAGPFISKATKKRGEEIVTKRKTKVCIRDNEIVGVYSYLTDDPHAPESDRDRATGKLKTQTGEVLRMAYGHVLVVDPRHRKEAIGSFLVGNVADEVFSKGYDQLTSCIDQVGDFGDVMKFVWSLGFENDRRKSSEYSYFNPDGVFTKGVRIILTKENWFAKRAEVVGKIKQMWNIQSIA
ncbi:MAG: hypothetical protein ACHQT7_00875 [Candidatus Levyibacteriota bacterium]